ncbi:uncharacterized protein LOC110683153 [Chenopodium quinoa]|uniref:Uncharacterized protein n=2 Tax=Chenopodium quinoa TaxID=63459 RepID=A0A803N391_CHEQI|nr:uncharacterized protein LOC110683153 [Chenopodium quinoa]
MASASVKMKPINRNQAGPSSSSSKPILKKKIEPSKSVADSKFNKSVPVKTAKPEEKGKAVVPATPVKKKREKKVFSLTGQKYDPPEEREPLRIFYESLSKQIPSSEMAEFWLMEHGLLSPERAKKAFERKQRKQKQLKMGTPIKSTPAPSRPESSNRQKLVSKNGDMKAKKKIVEDSDDEVIGNAKRRRA